MILFACPATKEKSRCDLPRRELPSRHHSSSGSNGRTVCPWLTQSHKKNIMICHEILCVKAQHCILGPLSILNILNPVAITLTTLWLCFLRSKMKMRHSIIRISYKRMWLLTCAASRHSPCLPQIPKVLALLLVVENRNCQMGHHTS